MKVLHITRQYAPGRGGIERFVQTLVSRLQAEGVDNRVLTLRKLWGVPGKLSAFETIDGVPVHRVGSLGPRQYRVAPIPDSLVRDCDLIHLHSSDYFFDAIFRKYFGVKPILLSSYGFYFHTRKFRRFKEWKWHHRTLPRLEQIAKVVCVSHQDATLLEATRPVPNHTLIPVGVDQPSGEPARTSHQWRFLSICRVDENKRLEDAVSLVATLWKDYGIDARFTHVGRDNGQLAQVQARVRDLGVEDRVSFRGEVSEEEKVQALREHDFLVSASAYESFGISIVEGMSYGLVPICSRIPSSEELVEDGRTGFLLEFCNPSDVQRVVGELQSSSFDFAHVSQQAQRRAKDFSWDQVTRGYLEAYKESLSGGGADV